ncbi:MAG TPA: ABC transporter permease, partial [Candidatus Omnitrophota bacterium]|nr:ABC transporter permease [Candidatus Omnitrophota bacterium]
NPEVSGVAREAFEEMYGLDRPVIEQYFMWLKRFLLLDFGRSLIDDRPVIEKVMAHLPATLLLQTCSVLLIFALAVPIGVISAVKRNSFFDRAATVFVFIGYAMPTFWLAMLLVFLFSFKLGWFPVSGMRPWYTQYLSLGEQIKDLVMHIALPLAATAFGGLAALSRYARSSMVEVLKENYVLTARAKGLREGRVILVHALGNALLPIVTILGLTLPVLISGSFIFETIFSWPGMGRLGYEAIMNYDYPVVMGVGVMATLLTLAGILLSDAAYVMIDPRIRFERHK